MDESAAAVDSPHPSSQVFRYLAQCVFEGLWFGLLGDTRVAGGRVDVPDALVAWILGRLADRQGPACRTRAELVRELIRRRAVFNPADDCAHPVDLREVPARA